jgi:hypothetical protein
MLPPTDNPEGGTGANDGDHSGGKSNTPGGSNPFERFINTDLDLSFMEASLDESGLDSTTNVPSSDSPSYPDDKIEPPTPHDRDDSFDDPPERRPFDGFNPFSPRSTNPFRPPNDDFKDDFEPPFESPRPFGGSSGSPRGLLGSVAGRTPLSSYGARTPAPGLEDPRWMRGVYRVRRDLRVYKSPSKLAQRVAVVPDANRRIDKSLRYIPNITSGWSAVHLHGEEPIIGFVDNTEVQLFPRRGLRDIWEDIALVVCLLLLVLALIANIDQLPFLNDPDDIEAAERITELEQNVADQQAQINHLEATISALRDE